MDNDAERMYYSRNVINLCMDAYGAEQQRGRLWSQYKREPVPFTSLFEALERMEELYDALQYPFASTQIRSFLREIGKERGPDEEGRPGREYPLVEPFDKVIGHRGQDATFIIRVQYRQHSTWQGEVVWAEARKRSRFGSILELMKLIDRTMEKKTVCNSEGED